MGGLGFSYSVRLTLPPETEKRGSKNTRICAPRMSSFLNLTRCQCKRPAIFYSEVFRNANRRRCGGGKRGGEEDGERLSLLIGCLALERGLPEMHQKALREQQVLEQQDSEPHYWSSDATTSTAITACGFEGFQYAVTWRRR